MFNPTTSPIGSVTASPVINIYSRDITKFVLNLLNCTNPTSLPRTVMGYASGASIADGMSLLTVPAGYSAQSGARLATTVADGAVLSANLFLPAITDYTIVLVGDSTFTESEGVFTLARGTATSLAWQAVAEIGYDYEAHIYVHEISGRVYLIDNGGTKLATLALGMNEVKWIHDAASANVIFSVADDGGFVSFAPPEVQKIIPTWNTTDATGAPLPDVSLQVADSATNLFLNSDAPVTQSISVAATEYTLWMTGSGSITLSGVATGTATEAEPLTFTPTAGTLTCTVSGTVDMAQLETGANKTSFILTGAATASRDADQNTIPTPSVLTAESGAIEVVCTPSVGGQSFDFLLHLQQSADDEFMLYADAAFITFSKRIAGVYNSARFTHTHVADTAIRVQLWYDKNSGLHVRAADELDDITLTSFVNNANLEDMPLGDTMSIGHRLNANVFTADFPQNGITCYSSAEAAGWL